jgi:AAA+ superfamily predicted ATPase
MKADRIINYLRAGFPAFWLRTAEPDHVRSSVYKVISDFERKDGSQYNIQEWTLTPENNDPLAVIDKLNKSDEDTLLFVYNWHWFADKPIIVQTIQNNLRLWSNQGKAIICVSHTKKVPAELEKEFVLLDLSLPDTTEIEAIIKVVAPSDKLLPKDEKSLARLINSCKGLTRAELENVLALSIVETEGEGFSTSTINEHKAMAIQKTGFLDVLEGDLNFSNVIGYNNIKQFVLETIDNPKAKGIMTIGPPGCGKTTLMKAIVGETGKFGLSVNMGSLFSKFQGETDQNINTVIDLITAIGDCVVLIDEFEKQFAGASSDGTLDSGTTRRATGRWLDFLQKRPEGVYIVGTANSFEGVPGEYLRPGRWDTSPFFIDLPTEAVCNNILEYYCKKTGIEINGDKPNMDQFSGAEIEAMVHIADMRGMSLKEASECILPQAKTMSERIEALRAWAKDRTIPAEKAPKSNLRVVKRRKRKMDT